MEEGGGIESREKMKSLVEREIMKDNWIGW